MTQEPIVPITPVQLTEAEFEARFKPVQNHIDTNAAWNGCLFETYGAELDHVQLVNESAPNTVWTQVTDDEGELVIVNGYHFVNRMGYLVCTVPFGDHDEFVVDDHECSYCGCDRDACIANPCEDRRAELEDDDSDEDA